MALIATIPADRGVIYKDAYVRVTRVTFFRAPDALIDALEVHVNYAVYHSAEDAAQGVFPHLEMRDIFPNSATPVIGEDLWAIAYSLLKTQLADAVDA
jgi:hypothetical protein